MTPYFSDRERGERPRTLDVIGEAAWGGLRALIDARIAAGWFGLDYPLQCPDGEAVCGTDRATFLAALRAEVPDIREGPDWKALPSPHSVLDAIEFCHRTIAQSTQIGWHDFHRYNHLRFERDAGQTAFRDDVNRIFARQGLAFELRADGQVSRLGPEPIRRLVIAPVFATGDSKLDQLLEDARGKYLSPDLGIREEAVEKLWDAFERLKTIEPGHAKPEQIQVLLARAASQPEFVAELDREARALTDVGNAYQIRHFEKNKVPLGGSEQVDYLVHRMFAFIWYCLARTGRIRA